MAIDFDENIKVDYLEDERLASRKIKLGILRLDKIHPEISGNKWFKLKENIKAAIELQHDSILTFGGAYSNHLAAASAAAHRFGLKSIGIVRGLHGDAQSSHTISFCRGKGMHIEFVSREVYQLKYDDAYLAALSAQYNQPYMIPEGGNNQAGRIGCMSIVPHIPQSATHVAISLGTGTTFCGVANALHNDVNLLGFPVMKGGNYLLEEVKPFINNPGLSYSLNDLYHFGGFAKNTPILIDFMNDFYLKHNIRLDFVYTAKMMYGVFDLIAKGYFPENTHLIAIHTGGLQGNLSLGSKIIF